jgi:alpha-L-fucosidase
VNLIFKGPVASTRLVIRNLTVTGAGRRLDDGSPVTIEPQGPDLRVTFIGPCADPIGTAVAVAV